MKPKYVPIITPENNSFYIHYQEKDEFDSPWHYHPEYELTYILSSTGVRYVGNNFNDFGDDDLVLLGPDLPHCWKNSSAQTGAAKAVVIQWGENFLGEGWLNRPEFESIKSMFQTSVNGIRFEKDAAIEVKDIMLNMVDMPSFDKMLALLQLLQQLAREKRFEIVCRDGFDYNLTTHESDRLKNVFNFIETNYAKKISLAQLSEKVFMSEESFSRFFSKVMKKPFFYFLNEYRINKACKMLIGTNEPVSQICYACGYESFPFFYRQFKKFKGCTPQKFRKEYLQAAD